MTTKAAVCAAFGPGSRPGRRRRSNARRAALAAPSRALGRRIHACIATSDGCAFTVGNEAVNMGAGEMWEINSVRLHSVKNGGDEARVHPVIDWIVASVARS